MEKWIRAWFAQHLERRTLGTSGDRKRGVAHQHLAVFIEDITPVVEQINTVEKPCPGRGKFTLTFRLILGWCVLPADIRDEATHRRLIIDAFFCHRFEVSEESFGTLNNETPFATRNNPELKRIDRTYSEFAHEFLASFGLCSSLGFISCLQAE